MDTSSFSGVDTIIPPAYDQQLTTQPFRRLEH